MNVSKLIPNTKKTTRPEQTTVYVVDFVNKRLLNTVTVNNPKKTKKVA